MAEVITRRAGRAVVVSGRGQNSQGSLALRPRCATLQRLLLTAQNLIQAHGNLFLSRNWDFTSSEGQFSSPEDLLEALRLRWIWSWDSHHLVLPSHAPS